MQACVQVAFASWGVQADAVSLQMLLLQAAHETCLWQDEAWCIA